MKQSSLFFSFPVCFKIYSRLLKSRQKSGLNPLQSPMGSFDCHSHGIFFLQKIFRKNPKMFDFRFNTPQKVLIFGIFSLKNRN